MKELNFDTKTEFFTSGIGHARSYVLARFALLLQVRSEILFMKNKSLVKIITKKLIVGMTAVTISLPLSAKGDGGGQTRAGRFVAISCAMLLMGGQVDKTFQVFKDPTRAPAKSTILPFTHTRRTLFEALISKALNKQNGNRENGSYEVVITEQSEGHGTGLLFMNGVSGYFVADISNKGKVEYTVYDTETDQVIESNRD